MDNNTLNNQNLNQSLPNMPQYGIPDNNLQNSQMPNQQFQQAPIQQGVNPTTGQNPVLNNQDMNRQQDVQNPIDHSQKPVTDEKIQDTVTVKKSDESADLGNNAVTKRDVENVVSSWTGIPISKLTEDESAKLLELEKRVHKRLIDQEEAVLKVSEAVRRGRIGLASGQRPIASFIFLGPSGTGKTELAKTLAEILFGRDDAMIRLDMSEYMEKHEVAKLIGAPPGYVGYEEGGQLTEAVRAKPYSIVLLDEVEKAHPDVFNILLQLLEDGRLTDNKGNTISFKNTIVICTSNIGSALITEKLKDQDTKSEKSQGQYAKDFAELSAVVNNELRKFFRPELLNRYDDIVIFKPLRREDMVGIAKLGVEKTAKLLKEQGYSVSITDRALSKLAKEGYDPMYGARPLRRLIQNSLENPIALEIIGRKYVIGDNILIDYKDDSNAFSFAKGEKTSEDTNINAKAVTKDGLSSPNSEDKKDKQMSADGISQAPLQGQVLQNPPLNQPNQVSSQMYYGQQMPQNLQSPNTSTLPPVSPVTNFDPLSVLGTESPTTPVINQSDTKPVYQPTPSSTGAYVGGGQDMIVNTNNFQQSSANETMQQNVLNNGQLTGSGLEELSELV